MKSNKLKIIAITLFCTVVLVNCDDNNDNNGQHVNLDFSGTFLQQDQMARPAINTVFIAAGQTKDEYNLAIPSTMGVKYQPIFQSRLLALYPGYTTNALTQTASQFTGLLATDVLNVDKTKTTTFYDGTNILTGRALADDVIDTELLLIFGGPAGTSNPGLTSDHVSINDKPFLNSFPYLATAW
ncbi:DUF4331 family protein [Flavobacterium sp. W1B]|uniref:DUF4331 family protein n=1 Tax=Flavobacterium sp. W1B TaxID=3394146 RepID=UPI0039BCE203